MFASFLKPAIRSIVTQKSYSFINIIGLAIGLAVFILILLHILGELSYDRFHKDYDRVYRIVVKGKISGDFLETATTSMPLAKALLDEYPGVESAVRFIQAQGSPVLIYGEKKFFENSIVYADSTLFEIFNFEPESGNTGKLLKEPHSIVLTRQQADKYFGEEDPVGKVIRMNDIENYKVTGVLKTIPSNTHVKADFFLSFSTLEDRLGQNAQNNWGSLSTYTYIRLNTATDPVDFGQKIKDLIMHKLAQAGELTMEQLREYNIDLSCVLQPVKDIHLYSHLRAEFSPNSHISYLYIYGAIGLFILILACVNFMNLTTARYTKRSKEIGIRKLHGAFRLQLVTQFLFESIVLTSIAMVIALTLVSISIPYYNTIMGNDLPIQLFDSWYLVLIYIGLAIIVGLFAGSYPSFYLSAFRPIKTIKGDLSLGSKKPLLRNALVVFQFTISVILIISTGLISVQLKYVKNKDIGFEKHDIITVPLRGERIREKAEMLVNEFRTIPGVESVSASDYVPGAGIAGMGFEIEGQPEKDTWLLNFSTVDENFINTLDMKLIAGRNFSSEHATDTAAVIINETLMKKAGWDEPIGKRIFQGEGEDKVNSHVVGVVKDFHYRSLHESIDPLVLFYRPTNHSIIILKLNSFDINTTIDKIEAKWNESEASVPFDFKFLEKSLDSAYSKDEHTGRLFLYFTILAIFIACLGLLGLSSFTAENKTREIGIRKTLGATTSLISGMLIKDFTKWVLLANVLAWPLAFFFIFRWLQYFAYRTEIFDHWWIFTISSVISVVIAIGTITLQSVRAANTNPVDALKYE